MCYDVDTGRELASKQVQFDPDSPETSKVMPSPWSDFQSHPLNQVPVSSTDQLCQMLQVASPIIPPSSLAVYHGPGPGPDLGPGHGHGMKEL